MNRLILLGSVLAVVSLAAVLAGCGGSGSKRPEVAASSLLHAYPGDTAPKPTLARWMGAAADAARLPPELPVMAALVESGLKNLRYGDADSAGFFQIPMAIWNQGDYSGYPDKPELQLKWFIDQSLVMADRRAKAGIDNHDERTWGEWIADVERPAAQFRGRYQLRLAEARRLLAG